MAPAFAGGAFAGGAFVGGAFAAMAQKEEKTQATLSRKRCGPESTEGKGSSRTERARFPHTEDTSGNSR